VVKNAYSVNALDKITVSLWASQISGFRKAKRSAMTRVVLAGQQQQQQLLSSCFNVLVNSFETANGLQSEILQLSSQYPRKG
jgi:hypothetical protein